MKLQLTQLQQPSAPPGQPQGSGAQHACVPVTIQAGLLRRAARHTGTAPGIESEHNVALLITGKLCLHGILSGLALKIYSCALWSCSHYPHAAI